MIYQIKTDNLKSDESFNLIQSCFRDYPYRSAIDFASGRGWLMLNLAKKSIVINCTCFESKSPLRSDFNYPRGANEKRYMRKGNRVNRSFKNKMLPANQLNCWEHLYVGIIDNSQLFTPVFFGCTV